MTTGFGEEPTEEEYAWRLDVGAQYDRGFSFDDGVNVHQDAGFSVEWTPTEECEPPSAPTEPEPVDTTPTWSEPPAPASEQPSSGWGTDLV